MKLKKYWKRFWTLDRHHAAGFTLVELIVVIAILAILAGVGIPVYSGYITKANKGADQTMVTTLLNSLEMAAIMDPDAFPEDATIYLSAGAAKVTGSGEAAMKTILVDTYGTGWANQLTLKSDHWALGGTVVTHASNLNQTLTETGGKLSYEDNIDELWDEVEYILVNFEGTGTLDAAYNGSSAELMASAANYTINNIPGTDKQAEFAKMWADPTDSFTAYGNGGYVSTTDKDTLDPMLARFAAVKARNHTFGNWLVGQDPSLSAGATAIQGASNGQTANTVAIPDNFMNQILSETWCKNIWGTNNEAQAKSMANLVNTYFGQTGYVVAKQDNGYWHLEIAGTYTPSANCPAYYDALGYYTLMLAVDDSAEDTKGMTNDQYLDTMGNAVQNVGAMLQDPTLLQDAKGGFVSITVKKGENGSLSFYGSDPALDLNGRLQSGRGQNTDNSKTEVTVTANFTGTGIEFTVDGALKLTAGQSGTITVVLSESYKTQMADEWGMSPEEIEGTQTGFNSSLIAVSSNTSYATTNGRTITGVATGHATITCTIDGAGEFAVAIEVVG